MNLSKIIHLNNMLMVHPTIQCILLYTYLNEFLLDAVKRLVAFEGEGQVVGESRVGGVENTHRETKHRTKPLHLQSKYRYNIYCIMVTV